MSNWILRLSVKLISWKFRRIFRSNWIFTNFPSNLYVTNFPSKLNYFLWIYANSNLSRILRQIELSNIWVFTIFFIKGGDTGNDCIGTSIRQGAKSITTFEILPTPPDSRGNDNPWPQYPRVFKVDYGHEEVKVKFGDDPRRFNTQSKEFLMDDNGRVSGIRTVLVQWTKVEGRWQMAEVPESEKIYPCQLVLLAMGFLGT